MPWEKNICIKRPHNCLRDTNCGPNSECCYERDTENGSKGKCGVCVARGSCNYKTGHPTIETSNSCTSIEGYCGHPHGRCNGCHMCGYRQNKGMKMWFYIILFFIAVVVVYKIL